MMSYLKILLLFFTVFYLGCDFTPQIHKKIMQAQDFIVQQEYDEAVKIYKDILKYERNPLITSKLHFQLAEIYLLHYADYKAAINYLK